MSSICMDMYLEACYYLRVRGNYQGSSLCSSKTLIVAVGSHGHYLVKVQRRGFGFF